MFGNRPAALLTLRRDAVAAYGAGGGQAQFDLTSNIVRNLEVVDPQTFAEKVAEFALEQGLRKKNVLVVLDESVIFQKTVLQSTNLDPAKVLQGFDAMLPFEPTKHRILALQPKGHLVLIGTNGDLYRYMVAGLQAMGAKVTAVVPISIYGKVAVTLSEVQVHAIIHNQRLAAKANFLDLEVKQ